MNLRNFYLDLLALLRERQQLAATPSYFKLRRIRPHTVVPVVHE